MLLHNGSDGEPRGVENILMIDTLVSNPNVDMTTRKVAFRKALGVSAKRSTDAGSRAHAFLQRSNGGIVYW